MSHIIPLYLDFASTTPIDPRVFDSMLPFFTEYFGNASSKDHIYGTNAFKAVEESREKVAAIINADPIEILFTSGATESINLGLIGAYLANKVRGNHIITVATEHKAVLETCYYLESIGAQLTILTVDSNGLIDLNEFEKAITKNTIIVSVMYVNNETGIIQDINGIGNICKSKNVIFFCDASQAVGKIKVNVVESKIDILCFSGHKINGPKGIGVVYIRKGVKIHSINFGGGQEFGKRPGTYNTPFIVGLAKACEIALAEMEDNLRKTSIIQEKFENFFIERNFGQVISNITNRSHYITSIYLHKYNAEEFIMLNHSIISISSGSACNSSINEPSHVIMAMINDVTQASKVIRLSYGIQLYNVDINSLNIKY